VYPLYELPEELISEEQNENTGLFA
jgi:hypothetical protein